MTTMRPSNLLALLVFIFFAMGQQTTEAEDPHLTPIFPFDPDGYDQAVFQSLVGDRNPSLWMIARPSFDVEYAVLVFAVPIQNGEPDPFGGGGRGVTGYDWVIEAAEVTRKIYQHKDIGDGSLVLDIKVTKDISRLRAGIPKDLGEQIRSAWNSVLNETRYISDNRNSGLDGITVQFGTQSKAGETWSPESGAPGLLFQLGQSLIELVSAQKNDRERQIQACSTLADKIVATRPKPEQGGAR